MDSSQRYYSPMFPNPLAPFSPAVIVLQSHNGTSHNCQESGVIQHHHPDELLSSPSAGPRLHRYARADAQSDP